MSYLVDANVLSEPTRAGPDLNVIRWLGAHEAELFVDAIILGELDVGIQALPAGRKRARLAEWFETLTQTIECLPWDLATARAWAHLMVDLKRRGRPMPLLDSMIAATALAHRLTIATRNTGDFERAGVEVVDPFRATG